ncbi:transporter [Jeongeupia sp. HS-3]|uniref:nicotinamide riboside transporter PnuC n=1 Tax=Jeongeupia sp. HS-3 TaxID=1009682 RepID=UPI0018A43986|nr:nicotinamide riboside transporter PnuC [Jeongeupia sp. HS-3]BCL75964.1 transporter [Jeongeupia sp. HS-3]
MSSLEIIGFIATLAGITLATRGHVLTWPLQLCASLLYVWLFLDAQLFGESALQLVYAALAIYGWWHWHRKSPQAPALPISRLGRREAIALNGAALAATAAVSTMQVHFLPTDVPVLDSTVFVFGLLAQWLQARKKIENWLYWIVLDLIAAGIYWHKDLQLTALLYLILTALAASGWWQWRKAAR